MMSASVQWTNWGAKVLLFALLYYLAARLGLMLAFAGSNASPVWPPSGIAIGVLLIAGLRLWPGLLLGALTANIVEFAANGVPWVTTIPVSTAIALGNTLEAVTGAWLLRRWLVGAGPFNVTHNVYKFAMAAGAVCSLAAVIGTASLLAGGIIGVPVAWTVFGTWWLGDVVGMLIIAPVLMAWRHDFLASLQRLASLRAAGVLLVLGVALLAIFGHAYAREGGGRWVAYLLLPLIGWSAYRHGARLTTLSCLAIAASSIYFTSRGLGPFATGTLNDSLFAIQTFTALCSLLGLVLCADMEEVRARQGQGSTARRLALHWATLFLGLGMTVLVWHLVSVATERRAQERFDAAAGTLVDNIRERMRDYEQGLRSARALFGASENVERVEWKAFIEGMGLANNFPGVQGLAFARVINAEQASALETKVREEGFPDFSIRPASNRERMAPVIFIEPFNEQNQRAFGYDLLSEPTRRAAFVAAERTGQPAITARLILRQENATGQQPGFLMFVPVFRRGLPLDSPAARRAALDGMVTSPFRMNDFMRGILPPTLPDVSLEIFDGATGAPDDRMFSSSIRSTRDRQQYPNPFAAVRTLQLQQHQWSVHFTSLAAFEDSIDRQKSQIVLVAGAIISLLLFGFVRSLAAREESAAARAQRMQSALADSEVKFETLINSATEFAIIATALDGTIRVFSAGAERMLGYAAADLVGKHTPALFQLASEVELRAQQLFQEDRMQVSGFDAVVTLARQGKAERREWTYVTRGGAHIPVSVVVTMIQDSHGNAAGFLGIANDISTEQRLQASLVLAKEQAEAASQAKTEFVANMSHEIRTPMNAVLGLSQLLDKSALMPEQRRHLNMIRTAGQSLLEIINDVLDFSKIEAGRMELSAAPFDLDALLTNCALIMQANAGEKGLELVVSADPGVPRRLLGDALRLQQVLTNLLSNAMKFTSQGAVSLFVEFDSGDDAGAWLRFIVSDTGIGIDTSQQQALFSAFTQADASITRHFGGTGLGLTISRSLVTLLGGTITLTSCHGEGSRFEVRLPFVHDPAPDMAPAPDRMTGLQVLMLGQSAASRRVLTECAQACGWRASVAADISSALDILATLLPGQLDVLVLDVGHDPTAAVALVHSARALPGMAMLAVVFINRDNQPTAAVTMPGAQPSVILMQPIRPDSLATALRSVLKGPAEVPAPAAAQSNPQFHALRALLVEDNLFNQVVARGILEAEQICVEVAGNGAIALNILRHDTDFDVILMDVQMPVLDGLGATRALRSELRLTIPVIAMSAGVFLSERELCTNAGMDDFVAKPVDAALLLSAIARHVHRAPRRQAARPTMENGAFDATKLAAMNASFPERRQRLLGLIERTLAEASPDLDSAKTAFAEGRHDVVRKLLHDLRGSMGTLGASGFVQACLAIEDALRHETSVAGVSALFDRAAAELNESLRQGGRWVAKAKAPD